MSVDSSFSSDSSDSQEPSNGTRSFDAGSNVLVVAGESSGDQHAAGLLSALQQECPGRNFKFFGSGGRHLAALGTELFCNVEQLAAIGAWEALEHLQDYWRLYRLILRESRQRRPSIAILVDFPEFNLRIAPRLKRMGIPVCYFISPQIWAWRKSRIRTIQKWVDLMLVIFPFEQSFYEAYNVRAHYIGNPSASRLLDMAWKAERSSQDKPKVALLPGSRKKEVEQIFPCQLDAARFIAQRHPAQFWVVKAPALERERLVSVYERWLQRGNDPLDLQIREEGTDYLLPQVDCAIIKSGTSTLEAMLLQVPFAMVYRVSRPTWFLLNGLVRTDVYCLANLIAEREIVPEFVQAEATGERIGSFMLELLQDHQRREEIREQLRLAAEKLGRRPAYPEGARLLARFLGCQKQ
ncbi:MAG: lipid-A-disaccharide synthase [Acidobacteria bacterium]|nr:lipid-A-disaccharide synthase [Acidobacteriota bacterium]